MKKTVSKVIAAIFAVVLTFTAFNFKSLAYSEVPDYMDFGDCVVSINAGSYADVWFKTDYNYNVFLGDHTSKFTYIDCTGKGGSEYVRLHIGADEQVKNVFFYFYIRDDRVADSDIHDCIEVYVQNIDTSYAQKNAEMNALKTYAGNNGEFNAYIYYTNYADLRAAFGTDAAALLNHYNTLGKAEGRVANKSIALK
jgi:hypothetical protein